MFGVGRVPSCCWPTNGNSKEELPWLPRGPHPPPPFWDDLGDILLCTQAFPELFGLVDDDVLQMMRLFFVAVALLILVLALIVVFAFIVSDLVTVLVVGLEVFFVLPIFDKVVVTVGCCLEVFLVLLFLNSESGRVKCRRGSIR